MRPMKALLVTRRIFWSLRHDPRTIGLMCFAPILAMCIFGIAFSGNIENVKVIVIDNDQGAKIPGSNVSVVISKLIIDNIDGKKLKVHLMTDEDDAIALIKDGKYNSLIIFPEDFSRSIVNASMGGGTQAVLKIRSDQSQVNVATEIVRAVTDAMLKTLKDRGMQTPVTVDVSEPIYGKGARFIDMFVPGIMGFVVFLLTTILTLISFVGERTRGTLTRLFANGLTEGEIVLGYAIAFSIVGMVQVGILLTVAILLFDIMVVGNPLIAFLIASLLAVVSVSLGILLSSLAHRESQAIQFFPLIILPVFLLSGVFWPREAMPLWLRPLSFFIPVTYAVDALRSVLIRGWGIMDIWVQILALIGFAAIFLTGAVYMLKFLRGR
jgi:ABC-2 type transport system permease protein